MEVPITAAKAQLDLVRRAERGDDVVLTRHGQPAVRPYPVWVTTSGFVYAIDHASVIGEAYAQDGFRGWGSDRPFNAGDGVIMW